MEASIFSAVFLFLSILATVFQATLGSTESEDAQGQALYKIEGKVSVSFSSEQDWMTNTRILIDGTDHLGFLRNDGSFTVNNLPSGSYIVEVANPMYAFEPARVDINSKGKIRARRLNHIQPSAVHTMSYPLKFKAKGKANYFQQREQWRITDLLFSPMVMMMILPFLMIMVLPKLINTADPETQKEMQSQMNLLNPKQSMPDLSEMITSFLSGGQAKKAVKPSKSNKKRPVVTS